MITEDQLCLDCFREGGYEYANDYDTAHEDVSQFEVEVVA